MGVISILTCKRTFFLAEAGKSIPSNMFWGTAEMRDSGEEVIEIAPAQMLAVSPILRLLRKIGGSAMIYAIAILRYRREINRIRRIYTITHVAAITAVVLVRLRLINARVSLLLIGAGGMDSTGFVAGLLNRFREGTYRRMHAIIFTTRLEYDQFQKHTQGRLRNLKCFPFGIDLAFYAPPSTQSRSAAFLIIGNDQYRDWPMAMEIARRCPEVKFRVITRSQNLTGIDLPANVTYLGDLPFAVSRDEFTRARAVLICSRPSPYFSGNTTIFAAMAAGAVVVADEDKSAVDCNLVAGKNWLYFPRGNVTAAMEVITALDEKLATTLAANAHTTVARFGMQYFARSVTGAL